MNCQGCGVVVADNAVLYTADGRAVCQACFNRASLAPPRGAAMPAWMWPVHVGAACALLTFMVSFQSVSMSSTNGEVTSFHYRDWAALGGGVCAIALAAVGLVLALRVKTKGVLLLYPIGIVLLGAVRVAAGFGVFATPTSSPMIADHDFGPPVRTPVVEGPCADGSTCFELGERLSAQKRIDAAYAAYGRACDFGTKGGCNNGAVIFLDSQPERAAPLLDKGCKLDHPMSCTNLGFLYLQGKGVKQDEKHGVELLTKACDLKEGLGCANLSYAVMNGMGGLAKDPARALALATQGCDLDSGQGCQNAGDLLFDGAAGIKKDPKRGLALLAKGCKLEDQYCNDYAISVAATDPAAARAAYTKACDAGKLSSCNNLGLQLRDGVGGPKDVEKGKAVLKKACDGGVDLACKNLK